MRANENAGVWGAGISGTACYGKSFQRSEETAMFDVPMPTFQDAGT